ncbi:hypothetical protein M406DRAFT_357705 [Cryphonectria parasitica EP155]|uniref:Uncharacterized protein n=1 Tax=Cryphonectria parasitica (strain ATCC 38755 / EP155) TaxID=660469 RepID=A0A9P4XU77_CRYP1|nr:uncharacterized protein M406DRAFT_357705 [Cryphonectria parasitica EP155]KAF3761362.1 hypothetical protein M406DRAFT_357705 [Cryphonectria parasitica EP155]
MLTPPAAHLSPSSSTFTSHPNAAPPGITSCTTSDTGLINLTSSASSRNPQSEPLYLLVCINGRAYKTLAELRHLDVYNCWNDELLMRGILEQYEQASKERHLTIAMLISILPASFIKCLRATWENIPISIRNPHFSLNSSLALSISEWWSTLVPHISIWAPLYIIDTADFVEFELVPHPEGKDAFPDYFTSGCWPPPDNRQYRYNPVPMKCAKTINLWHMRQPGPHTEFYWHNTVPKKLDGPLHRPPGTLENVVGYGVRINERLNDVLILWWSLVLILLTGLFIFVYSKCTGDNSSAFGLGAYLVAALTIYVQLQYAWWKRI